MSASTPRRTARRTTVAAALLGLVVAPLAGGIVPAAQANPAGTDLVVSEVYGGGGNSGATYTHDFVEIYNPTDAPISLNGKSLQYRAAATTGAATNVFQLPNANVPPRGHYLVQCAGGSVGVALPRPADTTACGLNLSGTTGQIYLVNGTTGVAAQTNSAAPWSFAAAVVDFVGFGTASIFEGSGPAPAPSTTRSVTRNATGTDTNNNAGDFTFTSSTTMTPTPASATPQPLSATDPADVTTFADEPITPITLHATGGTTPYSWAVSGLPAGLSETSDGVIGGTPTTVGTSTVSATVTDSATPTPASRTVEFTITVEAAPERLTIAQIQGTGADSPHAGETVITQGVVTARYPSGDGNLAGFFLQTGGEEGVDHDTPGASDAIFVFSGGRTAPAIGATVEVRGVAGERFGSTQINASAAASTITVLGTPQPPVVANATVPGTECALPGTGCLTGAALDAAREEFEGELFQPTGSYTVTDSYDGSPFTQSGSRGFAMQGEIGLAAESSVPLMIPTESIDQSDASALAARVAYNEAHRLILDDGADIDYTSASFEDTPFPWITPTHPVRVGAAVTFPKPVVLRFDFGFWRIQPQTKVAAGEDGQDRVAIADTRTSAPEDVLGDEGDLKIATFNMLNYFNTLGEAWAASDGSSAGNDGSAFNLDNPRRCSYHTDRGPVPPATGTAARITNDTCIQDAIDPVTELRVQLPGPRGAANEVNFLRQEAKELEAINTIDADVMSLEEVENSIKLYDPAIDGPDGVDQDRDDALRRLVQKLNEHWLADHPGESERWALVTSPRPEALPTVAEQDAIRSAFIYDPSTVEPVGRSRVLTNSAPFRNAREPLAQAFKPVGGGRADAFGVIVNHFKSKGGPVAPATVNGDNVDAGDGAGFYNGDRKRQAAALVAFADEFSADRNIGPVFLTGDFNSYSAEDPVQVIEAGGFTNLKPADGSTTYSFGGLAGSLDHVFANDEALAMVTGEDIWEINAGESVYYEYSRYNANAAALYAVNPFRSSDHNPEIVGIDVGELSTDPDVDVVQVLGINDFHGRLLATEGGPEAGAASLAGAVKELRAQNPDTVFAAAGDLIGASTFESFIQKDVPTIDALNEAGLEVSAVGNHEFDQGYDDLVDRVVPLADWEYIGANVVFRHTEDGHEAGDPALPETWCQTLPNGRVVGFVGAVTEDLDTLVSASAIEDLLVTDVVDAVNEHADRLKGPDGCGAGEPADLVVELVHEGAASTAKSAVTDPSTTFGQIVAGANENVDAIVSGHTHLAYNHKVEVPAWSGRTVTERPVVSAGQYGAKLNRLEFEFAPGGGELVDIRQTVVDLNDYEPDPATEDIVDAAVEYADAAGSEVLGDIEAELRRARRIGDDGQVVENRGGESTLGNLIAEMQRWKTGADIGFMNPGGLRADILGLDGTPREVTYRQAANAQPFANTLVTMELTGAEIKELLEQQWQRDADGNVPSRPFLRLGTSDGFVSTYDPSRPEGDRITGMWLDDSAVAPDETYVVSATSFLAGQGDNFWAFGKGANKQDSGKTDLEAVVDYLGEFAEHDVDAPLAVDYAQHQVGVTFAAGAPAAYEPGDTLSFQLSSLAMTGVDDEQDSQVQVFLGDTPVGDPVAVTNTLQNVLTDELGTASVSVTVPTGVRDGSTELTVRGLTTGTEVPVVVTTSDGLPDPVLTAPDRTAVVGQPITVPVTIQPATATGTVTISTADGTELAAGTLDQGAVDVVVPADALPVGTHPLVLGYGGDAGHSPATGSLEVVVSKGAAAVEATATPDTIEVGETAVVAVTVAGEHGSPTGVVEVRDGDTLLDSDTLVDGAVAVPVGPFNQPGTKVLDVRYLGDDTTEASSTTVTLEVVPAASEVTISAGPLTYGTAGPVEVVVSTGGPVASGTVRLLAGDRVLGDAVLDDGTAVVSVPGTALAPGQHELTAVYEGDARVAPATGSATVEVLKASSTTAASASPATVKKKKGTSRVTVVVSASGFRPTGRIEVVDGHRTWSGTLRDGQAVVQVGPFDRTGTRTLEVRYLGDGFAKPSASTVRIQVTNRQPKMHTDVSPRVVKKGGHRATLTVTIEDGEDTATGVVTLVRKGEVVATGRLDRRGDASLRLPEFDSTGEKVFEVRYSGDDDFDAVETEITVVVVR